MHTLVERCLKGDDQAWGAFWLIYEHAAAQPVRAIVRRFGKDASEADDVAIDLYLHLVENRCRRLRSVRGETDAELTAWLVRVACNFARDWIEKHLRAAKRERRAIKQADPPDRSGPSEAEVHQFLDDLDHAGRTQEIAKSEIRRQGGRRDKGHKTLLSQHKARHGRRRRRK